MKKCIKEYKRHGERYEAGKEYDISDEKSQAHESYLGQNLWEKSKKASTKAPAKKSSKKSK